VYDGYRVVKSGEEIKAIAGLHPEHKGIKQKTKFAVFCR
jgi:hypothetical protein